MALYYPRLAGSKPSNPIILSSCAKLCQDGLADARSALRVLACDQTAALGDDDLGMPRLGLFEFATAVLAELILEEKGHRGSHATLIFFGVGEAGDGLVVDQIRAICQLDVEKSRGTVADGGNDLASVVEFSDDLNRGLILDQIKHCFDRMSVMGATKIEVECAHVRDRQRKIWH